MGCGPAAFGRRSAYSDGRDVRQRLAANLRRLRHERGWSQEDYADRAGIQRTYVSDIERGARNPSIEVVEKMAAPFDSSASDLLA